MECNVPSTVPPTPQKSFIIANQSLKEFFLEEIIW